MNIRYWCTKRVTFIMEKEPHFQFWFCDGPSPPWVRLSCGVAATCREGQVGFEAGDKRGIIWCFWDEWEGLSNARCYLESWPLPDRGSQFSFSSAKTKKNWGDSDDMDDECDYFVIVVVVVLDEEEWFPKNVFRLLKLFTVASSHLSLLNCPFTHVQNISEENHQKRITMLVLMPIEDTLSPPWRTQLS